MNTRRGEVVRSVGCGWYGLFLIAAARNNVVSRHRCMALGRRMEIIASLGASSATLKALKSRKTSLIEHVACMEKKKNIYRMLVWQT